MGGEGAGSGGAALKEGRGDLPPLGAATTSVTVSGEGGGSGGTTLGGGGRGADPLPFGAVAASAMMGGERTEDLAMPTSVWRPLPTSTRRDGSSAGDSDGGSSGMVLGRRQ